MAQVCSARSDISAQITKLQGMTISSSSAPEAKASFEAIGKDLNKIQSEQPKLQPARRRQVESATKNFEVELGLIASGLASSVKSGNLETALTTAGPQLKSALSKLAADYKQALGPINC